MSKIRYVEELLKECDVILLLTNGEVGFPECKVLTKPLMRVGCHSFTFCLDAEKLTVQNIQKNIRGSLFFFHRKTFQSILLKGILSIEPLEKYKEIRETVENFQQIFEHQIPTIVCFETLQVDLYKNVNVSNIDLLSPKN